MAIISWKDKAERAQAALAKARAYAEDAVVHARHDGETIAAGAMAGAVRGAFEAAGKDYSIPGPGGVRIDPEIVLGGGILTLAFAPSKRSSAVGSVSRDLHSIGSGVLAYSMGHKAHQYMRARKAGGQ